MQDEITVSPLVDILSKQLGEQVVMSGDTYVYHAGLLPISQSDVDVALLEQQRLYEEEVLIAKQKESNSAIQNHLDTKAQEFRYDNMMSTRSYAGYTNPFQAEAQALAVWASNCWVVAGQIEADVQSGVRTMPTVDEVLAELPVYGG
jgi:hypothetical protein